MLCHAADCCPAQLVHVGDKGITCSKAGPSVVAKLCATDYAMTFLATLSLHYSYDRLAR